MLPHLWHHPRNPDMAAPAEYRGRKVLLCLVFKAGMRKIKLTTLLFLLLSVCVPVLASTASDFYLELLRRGTAEVDGGRYDTAVTPLRLAAFGLVDSIEHYETAQAYLAVALDKLNQQEEARRAALRVVTAEGIERKFATLKLPAAIRTAFNAVARKVLPTADAATLTSPPQTSTPPRQNAPAVVPTTAPIVPAPIPPAPRTETRIVPMPEQQPVETPKPTPPAPAPITAAQSVPQSQKPAQTQTQSQKPTQKPAPTPTRNDPPKAVTPPKTVPVVTTPPQQSRVDVPSRIAAAERALTSANLTEARRLYRELLTVQTLDRASLIRIGEGLYRARDFASALTAFRRLGTLRTGEEAYRYYIAIALYETADFAAAKRELAAALPFIEITPDVQRYRVKIEGARN
jgi:Flp pilus assembly protein TadD